MVVGWGSSACARSPSSATGGRRRRTPTPPIKPSSPTVGGMGLIIGVIILFFAGGRLRRGRHHQPGVARRSSGTNRCSSSLYLMAAVMLKSGQFPPAHLAPRRHGGSTRCRRPDPAATMVVAAFRLPGSTRCSSGLSIGRQPQPWPSSVGFTADGAPAWPSSSRHQEGAHRLPSALGYMVAALGVGAWTAPSSTSSPHAIFRAVPVPRRRLR